MRPGACAGRSTYTFAVASRSSCASCAPPPTRVRPVHSRALTTATAITAHPQAHAPALRSASLRMRAGRLHTNSWASAACAGRGRGRGREKAAFMRPLDMTRCICTGQPGGDKPRLGGRAELALHVPTPSEGCRVGRGRAIAALRAAAPHCTHLGVETGELGDAPTLDQVLHNFAVVNGGVHTRRLGHLCSSTGGVRAGWTSL